MVWMEIAVFFLFILMGTRLGSIGIGYAGGAGVLCLSLVFGVKAGSIPSEVILIIMSVISVVAALQTAGGMDYLVRICEKILRSKPSYIIFLGPTVTYLLTFLSGTGHTAFAALPSTLPILPKP